MRKALRWSGGRRDDAVAPSVARRRILAAIRGGPGWTSITDIGPVARGPDGVHNRLHGSPAFGWPSRS